MLISLIDRNVKLAPQTGRIVESSRRLRSSAATFNLLFGAVFIAWGLFDRERFGLTIVLGVCFLAYGFYGLVEARRLAKERP